MFRLIAFLFESWITFAFLIKIIEEQSLARDFLFKNSFYTTLLFPSAACARPLLLTSLLLLWKILFIQRCFYLPLYTVNQYDGGFCTYTTLPNYSHPYGVYVFLLRDSLFRKDNTYRD